MPDKPIHYHFWLSDVLVDGLALAAVTGYEQVKKARSRRRPLKAVPKRRPGELTPMWNALAQQLQSELAPRGSKAHLARYLGIPRQRITDYLHGGRRLPDAETLLRMLHWISERKAGRDPIL